MLARVYLETSVISFWAAPLSRDLHVAAHQQATVSWWDVERHLYEVVASELVLKEAQAGNPDKAAKRLGVLGEINLIELTEAAYQLANTLVQRKSIPTKAAADALHIAACVVHGVDFLLTWNCKHINNPRTRHLIDAICRDSGFEPTVICTPEELMEAQPDVE